jgi:WD40 repeat protein
VGFVAFSPDGHLAVGACHDGLARRWDLRTFRPLEPALSHEGPV